MNHLETTDNELPWIKYVDGHTWLGRPRYVKEHLEIVKFDKDIMYIDVAQYERLLFHIVSVVKNPWKIKPYGWYVR